MPPPTHGVVVGVTGLPWLYGGVGLPIVVGKTNVVGWEAPPKRELLGRKLPRRFQYEYATLLAG